MNFEHNAQMPSHRDRIFISTIISSPFAEEVLFSFLEFWHYFSVVPSSNCKYLPDFLFLSSLCWILPVVYCWVRECADINSWVHRRRRHRLLLGMKTQTLPFDRQLFSFNIDSVLLLLTIIKIIFFSCWARNRVRKWNGAVAIRRIAMEWMRSNSNNKSLQWIRFSICLFLAEAKWMRWDAFGRPLAMLYVMLWLTEWRNESDAVNLCADYLLERLVRFNVNEHIAIELTFNFLCCKFKALMLAESMCSAE